MCKGVACSLPFCSYRAGEQAMGRKKLKPSVKGRDAREQAYIDLHPYCESCLTKPAIHVHHVTRRGMGGGKRETSPLQALCRDCHAIEHGERPKDSKPMRGKPSV